MDIRSFHINYEVNAVLYDKKISENLKRQFFADVEESIQLNKNSLSQKNILYKTRDSLCRLMAPLL